MRIAGESAVLLSTSDEEGFPSTFLEAWTQGTPVVSLKIDPDHVIELAGLGAVCPDVNQVGILLADLVRHPERRDAIARRACQYVSSAHSASTVVAAFERALSNPAFGTPGVGEHAQWIPRLGGHFLMRVLVLHAKLGVLRGGGENFSRNLFAAFGERGHRVKAAFVADWTGRYPFPMPSNVEAIPMRGWWSTNLGQATMSAVGQRLTTLGLGRRQWDRVQNGLGWRTFQWHERRFKRRIVRDLLQVIKESDVVYVHSDPFLASAMASIRPTLLRLPGPVKITCPFNFPPSSFV